MTDKKSAASDFPSTIDPGLVERLAEIASRLGLSEIEVAQGDLRIRVARQLAPIQVAVTSPVQAPALVAPAPQSVIAPPADHPGTVKSPMVGTAYETRCAWRAPASTLPELPGRSPPLPTV